MKCEDLTQNRSTSDPETARHLAICEPCRQKAAVATWLRAAYEQTPPPASLQGAAQLWWRARILRRLTQQEQQSHLALRPLYWTSAATLAIAFLAFTLFLGSSAAQWLGAPAPADAWLDWTANWLLVLLALFGGLPIVTALPAIWLLWREG